MQLGRIHLQLKQTLNCFGGTGHQCHSTTTSQPEEAVRNCTELLVVFCIELCTVPLLLKLHDFCIPIPDIHIPENWVPQKSGVDWAPLHLQYGVCLIFWGFVGPFSDDSYCGPTKIPSKSPPCPIDGWLQPHLLHGLLHSRDICQHCQDFTLPRDVLRSQQTGFDKSSQGGKQWFWSCKSLVGTISYPNHLQLSMGMSRQNQWEEAPIFWLLYIWVNYNNSLTWNKAIWGWFPLLFQWGRSEVVIIYPDIYIYTHVTYYVSIIVNTLCASWLWPSSKCRQRPGQSLKNNGSWRGYTGFKVWLASGQRVVQAFRKARRACNQASLASWSVGSNEKASAAILIRSSCWLGWWEVIKHEMAGHSV